MFHEIEIEKIPLDTAKKKLKENIKKEEACESIVEAKSFLVVAIDKDDKVKVRMQGDNCDVLKIISAFKESVKLFESRLL